MARPYSSDLRIKVIKALDSNASLALISTNFDISIKTIYLWRKQLENAGHITASTNYQTGYGHKIIDLIAFQDFIRTNKNLSLLELAEKIGDISPRTIQRAIKKIKYHRLHHVWLSKRQKSAKQK